MTESDTTPPPPRARRFGLLPWWLGLAIVALGAPGGYMLYDTRPQPMTQTVTGVRIEHIVTLANPSAAMQEAVDHATSIFDRRPDYFLEVVVAGVPEPLVTPAREDTPIGNGLTFQLPKPVALEDLREVLVRDKDVLSDDTVDRVDVTSLQEKGQIFAYTMITPDADEPMSRKRLLAWVLVIAAGAGALIGVVRFIALQVV